MLLASFQGHWVFTASSSVVICVLLYSYKCVEYVDILIANYIVIDSPQKELELQKLHSS